MGIGRDRLVRTRNAFRGTDLRSVGVLVLSSKTLQGWLVLAKEVVPAHLLQQRLCWLSYRRHIGALQKHCHMSLALSESRPMLMYAGRMKFDPREQLGSTEQGRARLLKALMSNSLSNDGGAVVGHVDPEHLPRRYLPPGRLGQICHGCSTAVTGATLTSTSFM